MAWVGSASLAQPLPELYRSSLARDPAIAAAAAQVRAAAHRVTQAEAGFGPTATLSASKTETRYREAPQFELRPFAGTQASVQVTQPLLRTALVPALDAAHAQLDQALAGMQLAETETGQRLVEAAFELLKVRDALLLLQAQAVAAAEQLQLARRSFEVGTASITDTREAEAKADAIAAQRIGAEAELDLRQQVLAELTGSSAPSLLRRGLTGDGLPTLPPASILEWLSAAQEGSALLRQARLALATAEAEVRRAWHGHAPTVDLTYSFTSSSDTGTVTSVFPRRGDSSAVGLNVNIPLFASGATQAKVKEALALRDKADADVQSARRNVVLGVRQSFSAALAAIGRAHGLETAVRSQELAMRANRRGYEVGMKVNAEVLESQSRLYEVRRDLSRARYDAWIGYTKLKALAGRLLEADIAELDSLLVDADATPLRGPNRTQAPGPK